MSMKHISGSGYVIELSALIKVVPEAHRKEFQDLLENEEPDFEDFFENPEKFPYPAPEEIFMFGDEDDTEDLEKMVRYAIFAESDLFVKRPTQIMCELIDNNIEPKFHRWTVWG